MSIVGDLLVNGETAPFYRSLLEANIGSGYSPVLGYELIPTYMILYMYMCESVCVCIYSPVLGYELIPTYMILYMYMCESVCVCIYSPILGYELIPTYMILYMYMCESVCVCIYSPDPNIYDFIYVYV